MQLFIKSVKNKIFLSLTFVLLFAAFFIVRGCEYPLITQSAFLTKVFVSRYSEKLFYNLSLSYVAAYIFYIIQIYIPETVHEKKALQILRQNLVNEMRLISEFLFLTQYVTNNEGESSILYSKNIPEVFYKECDTKKCLLKRFSSVNTLKTNLETLIEVHQQIVNNHCYSDLNSYILYLHSLLPLKEMKSCIDCINYSSEPSHNIRLVSDNFIVKVNQFEENMELIIPGYQKVKFEQCDNRGLRHKYIGAFNSSALDEYSFALYLSENPYDTMNC